MTKHGFFDHQEQLKELAKPIISILNGSNDIYSNQSAKRMPEDRFTARYYPSDDNDTIVEGKKLACDILIFISMMETDAKCTVIMGKLKEEVRKAMKALGLGQSVA